MLAEGYDNPWIAISVFVRPAKELPVLVQYHGRACRAVPHDVRKSAKKNGFQVTTGGYAYMYYPSPDMDSLVKDYDKGTDETDSGLSGTFSGSFKEINKHLAKQTSENAASELEHGFILYHEKYFDTREKSERGKKWDPVPSEHIAGLVAASISGRPVQLSVIDFGCGAEHLFEAQLFQLVEVCSSVRKRIRHFGCSSLALTCVRQRAHGALLREYRGHKSVLAHCLVLADYYPHRRKAARSAFLPSTSRKLKKWNSSRAAARPTQEEAGVATRRPSVRRRQQ